MIRTLLATTALAAVLATGALAQDASSSSAPMDNVSSSMVDQSSSSAVTDASSSSAMTDMSSSSAMTDMSSSSAMTDMSSSSAMTDMSSSSMMDTSSSMMDMSSSSQMATPSVRQPIQIISGYTRVDSDRLASKIIGQPVFDSTATDANNLGKINDLVVGDSGQVAAVVIGVGGFLGIGEKQVAVDYTALQWTVADDKTERFVLKTTVDELTQAPDFATVEDNPASGEVSDQLTSSSSSAAQ